MHPESHLFFWACLPGHGALGGLRALSKLLSAQGRRQKSRLPTPRQDLLPWSGSGLGPKHQAKAPSRPGPTLPNFSTFWKS